MTPVVYSRLLHTCIYLLFRPVYDDVISKLTSVSIIINVYLSCKQTLFEQLFICVLLQLYIQNICVYLYVNI